MVSEESEKLLSEIGQVLAEGGEDAVADTLLYAQVGDNWCSPAVFEDLGNHILYRDVAMKAICNPLMDLWDEAGSGPQWAEMEYLIRDGRFAVTYTYPEEIDPEEDEFRRRDRIVARYFGEKPILYPPWKPGGGRAHGL